ncbi:hypothetical protein RCC89_12590 [Cytophagaceae bacterium ABcell3]|nr:hypothetical protein RCC89_12590 [Cytophagaceae bacterium ABcell3]
MNNILVLTPRNMNCLTFIKTFAFIVFASSVTLGYVHKKPPGAELIKTKNGISLYERWVNLPDKKVNAREVILTLKVDASPNEVVQLISNANLTAKWNTSIRSAKMLEQDTDCWIKYVRYNIPWPFNDQDCILEHRIVRQTPSTILIEYSSIAYPSKPPVRRVDRIDYVKGQWEIRREGRQTHITYSVLSTPSNVPRWITDPFVRDAFISSMTNLKNML